MTTSAPHPIQHLSDVALAARIDAALLLAGDLAPPRNTVEAQLLGAALSDLRRLQDEAFRRRARAREAPSASTTGTRRGRPWLDHAREDEIGSLVDALHAAQQQAGANVAASGRGAAGARVLLSTLRDTFTLRGMTPARFRVVVLACERRDLIRCSGPFITLTDGRGADRRGAGAAQRVLELTS